MGHCTSLYVDFLRQSCIIVNAEFCIYVVEAPIFCSSGIVYFVGVWNLALDKVNYIIQVKQCYHQLRPCHPIVYFVFSKVSSILVILDPPPFMISGAATTACSAAGTRMFWGAGTGAGTSTGGWLLSNPIAIACNATGIGLGTGVLMLLIRSSSPVPNSISMVAW